MDKLCTCCCWRFYDNNCWFLMIDDQYNSLLAYNNKTNKIAASNADDILLSNLLIKTSGENKYKAQKLLW
jgi:hypothetical protein